MDNPCKQCHSGFCSAHQHPEYAVWERITQEHAALGNQVAAFATAIRNAALEEAAKACEDVTKGFRIPVPIPATRQAWKAVELCASAVRALKS